MWLHDPQHTGRSSHVGPQTNNVKWTIDLESVWIPSAPAVAQDRTVYLVTSQGLYAIHPSGQSLWVYEPSHTPWGRGTPAIGHNGAIYVTRSGGLSAINPDGSLEWDATVAVDYDSVQLVLDQQGTLYYAAGCVLPSDEQVHPCLIAFDPGGDVSWVYDLENGVTYQQPDFSLAPEGSLGSSSPGLTTSPTIGHNGVIYIGYGQTLFAINADGTEEWRKTFLDVARDDGIVTPSIGSDGTIYVIVKCAERADECKDYMYAINPGGSMYWEQPQRISGYGSSIPLIGPDDTLYVSYVHYGFWGPQHYLTAFDAQGNPKWTLDGEGGPRVVDAEGTIYTVLQGRVRALDPGGNEKWTWYTPNGDWVSPLSLGQDGTLYAAVTSTLYGIGPEFLSGTISPVYPTTHTISSTVMQGGTAYRYFRLTDADGNPIPNATVTLSTSETALSDTSGYFTATISADGLGGLGNHTVSVQSVTYGGQIYSTDGQPSFTVQVTERRYSYAWGYGASTRLKGGVSAGLIAYVQKENSGGLELTLDESDPSLTADDIVLMKEQFSDEIGAGGGVGIEKGISILILQIKGGASAVSERYIRTLGSTTARFPNPYKSDDKKAQAIFLLASVIDSLAQAFPGKPFAVGFLKVALDRVAPYKNYISEQQAGLGAKITPLQANVGASASLGLKRGGATWKERILGFDLVDMGVTVLTLDTFTDYRDRGEIGLGSEAEFDLDFSALSWQIGDFRNKFAGTIGDRAKKIRLEIILDADTHESRPSSPPTN